MNGNMTNQSGMGTGFLVVQVTTAQSAIPLEGAAVTIRRSDGGDNAVLFELRSGRDGRTERVALSAPPRANSQRPSTERPYAMYNIEVRLDNYENAFYQNVPVFDGITAIQQANLLPVPENGYPGSFTLNDGQQFEGEEPQLWRG